VLLSRTKAVMLGLLAVMLVGSIMATTASAEAGPFWYHRPVGEVKNEIGTKLAPGTAEQFTGSGGEQKLLSHVKSEGKEEAIEINSPSTEVKGDITNGEHQGQIKLEIAYKEPKLVGFASCVVTIGTNNTVVVKGHLAWKWNGEKSQLEEQPQEHQTPDIVFTPVEPQEQKPFVEVLDLRKVGVFTTLSFKPLSKACGPFSTLNKVEVQGSEVGIPNRKLNEFSKTLAVRTIAEGTIPKAVGEGEGFLQHIWNGTRFLGLIVGLEFGGLSADLIGQTETEAAQQEIAVREK
jgi:hypothetical protein